MSQIENKKGVKKSKIKVFVLNFIAGVAILGGLVWAISAYLKIGTDSYTNAAQVETFVNPINARVSAYVKEIRFTEHQQVKAGDTLVILDNREIITQVGQAEAAYKTALANKVATQNSVRTVSNNVSTADFNANAAKANIEATEARLKNTELNYQRYKSLLADAAVTKQQFDQMEAEYQSQISQLAALKSQYQSAVNAKGTSSLSVEEVKSRLAMNDADIQRAENALEMAKLNLTYCYILAPHDGVMGRRVINEGQLLTMPGQQVATIVDNRSKWVTANFREKQMHHIAIGNKAKIKVDALGGQEFDMIITAISEATGARFSAIPVDNSTGNFVKVQQRIPVRMEFDEKYSFKDLEALKTGMNVEVNVQ
ncbi:MAG: HlyD family secretion protein [Chitinophagales bacterium]|nr:HlyD family secretion protein [Chitinophagales bacterium]